MIEKLAKIADALAVIEIERQKLESEYDELEHQERTFEMIERLESLPRLRVTLSGAFVDGSLRRIDPAAETVTVDVDGKPYIYDLSEFAEGGALYAGNR